MGKKYFCWSIDDGLEQDKKITEYLKKCNMGATFNLNSGMLGKKQFIGRIGNIGLRTIPMEKYCRGRHILKYCKCDRIPEDEIAQVYEGFEVSSHGFMHECLKGIPEKEVEKSIVSDLNTLAELLHTEIKGFAYPFGAYDSQTLHVLKKEGVQYARTVKKANGFDMPDDFMQIPITAWHMDQDVFEKLNQFKKKQADEDLIFIMFGHGYEFDFNTKECNWQKFQKICDIVATIPDIICCSMKQALHLN